MRYLLASCIALAAISDSAPLQARYVPSFNLSTVAWHATDIVLVTEGQVIDGEVEVLEVWKGEKLVPGQSIFVAKLRSFKSQSSREIAPSRFPTDSAQGPKHVTGERIVVFLRSAKALQDLPHTIHAPDHNEQDEWLPASTSWFCPWALSFAWIEGERVFAFAQHFNPGPFEIADYGSLADFKRGLNKTVKLQSDLGRARAVADPVTRAQVLRRFVGGIPAEAMWHSYTAHQLASYAAFEALSDCGRDALPVLREMLADSEMAAWHWRCVQVLAEIGKLAVESELIQLAEDEQKYWANVARGTRLFERERAGVTRWTEDYEKLSPRAAKTFQILYCLHELGTERAKRTVVDFRAFWQTHEQLCESGIATTLVDYYDNDIAQESVSNERYYGSARPKTRWEKVRMFLDSFEKQ